MKKFRIKHVFQIVLVLLIAGLFVENYILHPFSGNSFDLLRIDKTQVCEIQINHYGETVHITEQDQINTVTSLFNCSLERRGNDYLAYSNGGDWYIQFVTKEGTEKGFMFFPSNGEVTSGETKIKIGHYYYACDVIIDASVIGDYWKIGQNQN